ncbi:hypothetical protein [Humisphaera borealis]|uniref:Uncharacterized protein n=1 Tax=Humisphaera borealis TaxID=2807512 RepID=A0A7M2WS40_9BACT|nr:hypothetical protein [Humisphaera borealis]QOV87992.1 hypothetical protein IPV69_17180 [Humisphaera borealis]
MRKLFPFVLCGAFLAVPAISGCDRTVSKETETVKSTDGTSKTTEKKVTEQPDGTLKETTTEKKVEK